MNDWKPVVNALLGSWPSQVASWGREVLAAYCAELEARGLSPEDALVAIRQRSDKFPPSAGELAAEARRDPDRPTFDEVYALIYGRGGVLRARPPYITGDSGYSCYEYSFEEAQQRRLAECHPLVQRFVAQETLARLASLEVDHELYGDVKRKELRLSWERLCDASEGRVVAGLARRSGRGSLGRPDLTGAIGSGS